MYRDTQKIPDLGFAILPDYEGKGYTFEAAKNYLEYAQAEYQPEKIIAILFPHNVKSINLLEKLKFKFQTYFNDNNTELMRYILD